MQIQFSEDALRELKKIKRKDKNLYSRIQKQLLLFARDPKHRSLHTHKLSGKLNNQWSFSVTNNIRVIYIRRREDLLYIINLGTHDQVYKP